MYLKRIKYNGLFVGAGRRNKSAEGKSFVYEGIGQQSVFSAAANEVNLRLDAGQAKMNPTGLLRQDRHVDDLPGFTVGVKGFAIRYFLGQAATKNVELIDDDRCTAAPTRGEEWGAI